MKADPFVQLRLLELQGLDSALDRLRHRRRTLPELAEMARLDGLVDALRDGVVRAETEVSDLAREQREVREGDRAGARPPRPRRERLASGAITASKQLQDLEHEVALAQAPAVRPRGRRARGDGARRDRAGGARPS